MRRESIVLWISRVLFDDIGEWMLESIQSTRAASFDADQLTICCTARQMRIN